MALRNFKGSSIAASKFQKSLRALGNFTRDRLKMLEMANDVTRLGKTKTRSMLQPEKLGKEDIGENLLGV
jgi:hypothetical protein